MEKKYADFTLIILRKYRKIINRINIIFPLSHIKEEKRKYNKTFFNEYFETNIFLRGFYSERCNNIRSDIKGWKLKIENENDEL